MTEKKEFFYFIEIREHTSGNSDVFLMVLSMLLFG